MTPIEMHYSGLGFVYRAAAWLGEKSFDVVLAGLGTWLGYWLARRHLEHFVSDIVKKMDAKYLNLNREVSFQKAVTAMIPEVPRFYLRPNDTFSPQVAAALAEFTHWTTAIDPAHTPEQSMKLVSDEAYTAAAGLIEKDRGFREAAPIPNYEWQIVIGPLPKGWTVEESPDLTIFNWDTGVAVYRHALMKETARTETSIEYNWMWDMKDVACGLYVGVVNFTLGGTVKMRKTASPLGKRLRIFLIRENDKIVKSHEDIPW